MREIKYRAWHPGLHCMSEVLELDFQHDAIRCVPGHLPKNRLSDVVLMQFTGLHDKNGKRIYDGDIVRNTDKYRPNVAWTGVIKWQRFYDSEMDSPLGEGFPVPSGECYEWEIIGNIYENPELLTGTQS